MSEPPRGIWTRQRVLFATLIVIGLLTIIALSEVLATVFFAMTVAYILSPARRWLRRRGAGRVTATLLVTAGATLALLVVVVPLVVLLFVRFEGALAIIQAIPPTIEIGAGAFVYELTLVEMLGPLEEWLRATAIALSAAIPVFVLKFVVFVFVVFALVHNERDITASVMRVVPTAYRDIAEALHRRARDTLAAIYLLQGATAVSTALFAIPVFYLLGYDTWFALAILAGVLQFVPVIGPSLLIVVLAAAEVLVGDLLGAVVVLVVGGVIVAAAPDVIIRPRVARYTTKLSSALYFIGFVGGLLTLGAIGVIVGPLMVALLVESTNLVSQNIAEGTQPSPSDPPG